MRNGKLIVLSAPSGSGKSTMINHIMSERIPVSFSVSATSRKPRGTEKHGVEYYFLTPDEFREKIKQNHFIEYEEVYTDHYYGTLRSEVERQLKEGNNVILDVDVAGGLSIKKLYTDDALLIFIQPPSIEELEKRLINRGTDSIDVIKDRISKAEYELGLISQYDKVIVNDDLDKAKREITRIITDFLNS